MEPPLSAWRLLIDTATPQLVVALDHPERGQFVHAEAIGRRQAELLPSVVADLFAAAGLQMQRPPVSQIIVGTGPGSYTGVRIGTSYAMALGRAWNAELLGLCSLTGLLTDRPESGTVQAPAFDARKGQVYAAVYRRDAAGWRCLHPPEKMSEEDWIALAQRHGAARLSGEMWPAIMLNAAESLAEENAPEKLLYL